MIFPFFYYLLSYKINKYDKPRLYAANISFYLPIFILFFLGIIILTAYGKLKHENLLGLFNSINTVIKSFSIKDLNLDVLSDQNKIKSVSYNLFLLRKYIVDFSYILIISILIITAEIAGEKFYKKFKESKFYSLKLEYFLFSIIGITIFAVMRLKPWMWYMTAFGFVISYLAVMIIKKIDLKKEFFFIFWGIIIVIVSFLGSNNSFRHSVPAGAVFLIVPITALMNHDKKNILEKSNLQFLYRLTVIFFIVLLTVSGYKKIFDDNKRDVLTVFKRNTMFKSPELFGIFSTKDRVDVIDRLIVEAKKNIKKSDKIICVNSIPMLHYLLNRDYFLDDPWLEQMNLSEISYSLENNAENNNYPAYIIFSKKSARENNWPNTTVLYEPKDKEKYDYMLSYIEKSNYKNIYENNAFILYKK